MTALLSLIVDLLISTFYQKGKQPETAKTLEGDGGASFVSESAGQAVLGFWPGRSRSCIEVSRRPRRKGACRFQWSSARSLEIEGGRANAHGQPIKHGHDYTDCECRSEECRTPREEQVQDSPLSGNPRGGITGHRERLSDDNASKGDLS